MSRAPRSALVLVLLAGMTGCGGDKDTQKAAPKAAVGVISPELVGKMWPVRLSDDAARQPYEADSGWMHLFERSYDKALAAFASSGNAVGLARIHQEYAAVYRQGALVAVNATHHAYGNDRASTDPVGLQYMVGVSETLRGASGVAAFAEAASEPGLTGHVQAWTSNADLAGGKAPASMDWYAARTGAMGPVKAGARPLVRPLPHYQFPENTAQRALVAANDPTLLLGLSQWHLEAARAIAPDSEDQLSLLMSGWRLPVEAAATGSLSGDDVPWLFGRPELCADDLEFLIAVDTGGPGEVVNWAEKSPLAAALAPAWDGQKLDHQVVLDQSVLLMRQAQAEMVKTSGGEQGFHRPFALFVRLGVLQAGMRVADKAGQYRDAGILRLEALERMEGGKGSVQRDPAFALSVAAWDASNRSPLRPEDILHKLIPDFPALAAARSPLEALHLRLNRHAAPSTPVH